MADDSDEDQPKRIVENQPYDETLEVPDGEDVASIYTPTPRHPRNAGPAGAASNSRLQNQNYQLQNQLRSTPPPSSSSGSLNVRPRAAARLTEEIDFDKQDENLDYRDSQRAPQQQSQQKQYQQSQQKPKGSKMSDSPIEIQKFNKKGDDNLVQPLSTASMAVLKEINKNNDDYGDTGSNRVSTSSHDLSTNKLKKLDNDKMYERFAKNDMEGGESGSDGNESEESQYNYNDQQGGYDPAAYRDLPVTSDIKDIFKFIERYHPQDIELDFKLKPFIPDYIPSIGDIDAFLKVPRPDNKEEQLGLVVVDEPSSNQSDPHVLDLFFRTLSKQTADAVQPTTVKSVENSNTKAIDSWIRNISALQKNKPIQTVNYQKPMPTIDALMQEWPPEYEELVKEVSLPSPELDVDINTYTDIICALLDIPVYKSRIQSIHVLLTLFSEFKNSEHFRQAGGTLNPYASGAFKGNQTFDGGAKGGGGAGGAGRDRADRLVID